MILSCPLQVDAKSRPANEDEVRFSALASMCLADDDLAGSQLSPGTPSSLPRDKMVSNPLSLYSSFLAFQAQHCSGRSTACRRRIVLSLPGSRLAAELS
jgi:hypothetical protein